MQTPIWLTDEPSEISGFLRAKTPAITYGPSGKVLNQTQPNRSDCPSLVRATVASVLGPAVLPVVRKVGSAGFVSWLTDPLDAPSLSGGNWQFHLWGLQDATAANMALRVVVSKYGGSAVVSATSGALGTVVSDVALTSAATPQQLSLGDRLLIQVNFVDVSGQTMQAGHTGTMAYNGLYSHSEGDSYLVCPDTLMTVGDVPDEDVTAIRSVLRDASSQVGLSSSPTLDDWEIERFIIQAIETYSVDRPFAAVFNYSGDGNTFDFPLPPKWIWSVSRITQIEYPAAQQIPNTLEYLDWEIREDALGMQPVRKLRLRTIIPDNLANNLYVQYSTRHRYDSEYSTIPREDQDAVLWLAASYCATAISAKFAGATDSSLAVDAINYQSGQQRWQAFANSMKDLYLKRVVEPDAATPV
ncbi:MAG TPA: hypothetical protein VFK47_18750, partial [Ktedonobacteraceae bacterium]|nr:hypothetical protein [Ktedonobacteraceae bacterium]